MHCVCTAVNLFPRKVKRGWVFHPQQFTNLNGGCCRGILCPGWGRPPPSLHFLACPPLLPALVPFLPCAARCAALPPFGACPSCAPPGAFFRPFGVCGRSGCVLLGASRRGGRVPRCAGQKPPAPAAALAFCRCWSHRVCIFSRIILVVSK